jgi:hypothetical protein
MFDVSARMSEGSRQPIPLGRAAADREYCLPPAWLEFIRYCRDLRHGEIERLSIQDGLPVLAEVTKKKVKFHQG